MREHPKICVLGVLGSPRRRGNTETLMDELLRGAEEAGAFIEKIVLSEMDVKPCRACDACRNTGSCIIDDDMTVILDKMSTSQVWIIGTPVYWWGPTAWMKAFIDRWYGVDRKVFRDKGIVLIVPSGGGSQYAKYTVLMLESIIPYLGMKHIRTIQAPGSSIPGAVKSKVSLMKEAWTTGYDLVDSTN